MTARDDYPADGGSHYMDIETGVYADAMDEIDRLRNALKWIHFHASIHYMGGGFDPEHMAELANLCADALNGKDLDDYDAAREAAKIKAQEWKELFSP